MLLLPSAVNLITKKLFRAFVDKKNFKTRFYYSTSHMPWNI